MGRKSFIAVATVLLSGAGLWGWIAFNAGSEWPPSFLDNLMPEAKAVAHYDPAKQRAQEVANQQESWGGILVKGCEAGMADFRVGRFDTDGDDVADKVCWRTIQTTGDGNFVGVAVIAKNPDGTVRRRGYAVLPVANGSPDAGDWKIGRKAWTDKDLSDHQWAAAGVASPVSVAVSQPGEAAWLFWPKAGDGEAVIMVTQKQVN